MPRGDDTGAGPSAPKRTLDAPAAGKVVGVSWFRRAAERLRFADRTTGLRIQWQEVPQRTNGIAGRGVRVDVSRLRAGRYRMQLTVNAAGETSAISTREIDVR